MASSAHTPRMEQGALHRNPTKSIGNATPTSKTATSPWTSDWKMPDVGFRRTQQRATSSAKQSLGSLKTGRIARKLGELALANDLAYIPRMPDDAVVGINPDASHSRESYLQAHNAAIDFTRQLPRGTQPAFFNPSTHTLVPLHDGKRHHTAIGLQADQETSPTPDLLDLEFMANKPQTVHDIDSSRTATLGSHNATTVRRYPSQKAFQAYKGVRPDTQQALQTRYKAAEKEGEGLYFNAKTPQKTLPRVPTQLRPTTKPTTSQPTHDDNRNELFYSPPGTFQDYPSFDVLVSSPVPTQSTTATPKVPQRSNTSHGTKQGANGLTPAKPLRPPATWDGHPQPPGEPTRATPTPKPATYHESPLSFDGIRTFSPRGPVTSTEPSTSKSTSTSNTRRQTVVHRQKTSQQIWADQASTQAQTQQDQKAAFEKSHAEKLRAMQEAVTREQQATEKAAFERRHAERVKAMQDAIAADQAKATAEAQAKDKSRLRPVARTFQPDVEEHRLRTRTRTHSQSQGGTLRERAREQQPQHHQRRYEHENKDNTADKDTSLRPTARTFHLDQPVHYTRPQHQPQPQPQPQSHYQQYQQELPVQAQTPTPTYTPTPTTPSKYAHYYGTPTFRRWQPNPSARTFDSTSAGAFAAEKRRDTSGSWEH